MEGKLENGTLSIPRGSRVYFKAGEGTGFAAQIISPEL